MPVMQNQESTDYRAPHCRGSRRVWKGAEHRFVQWMSCPTGKISKLPKECVRHQHRQDDIARCPVTAVMVNIVRKIPA